MSEAGLTIDMIVSKGFDKGNVLTRFSKGLSDGRKAQRYIDGLGLKCKIEDLLGFEDAPKEDRKENHVREARLAAELEYKKEKLELARMKLESNKRSEKLTMENLKEAVREILREMGK